MTRRRLREGAVLLLLAGLLAVLAVRAVHLARHPDVFRGLDERKWLGWAYRVPGLEDTFAPIRETLPPGEDVWLVLPGDADPVWWGVMARYHLPEQRVIDVLRRGEGRRPPRGAWVVAVGREGQITVRRRLR